MSKPIIYQMLPRLWGNDTTTPSKDGCLAENGTGKFSDIDVNTLEYLKWLGCSHVWYTGIIRHSTQESEQGCIPSHPQFVKGKAGSPYAICDYFDVNAYLADDPQRRMEEFEALVERTHKSGLKVIIDFVPNHVSRDYGRNFSYRHPQFA
jgi:glycosidase